MSDQYCAFRFPLGGTCGVSREGHTPGSSHAFISPFRESKAMAEPIVHFAGGMKIGGTEYLRGWAVCCTGRRCEKIRTEGEWTFIPKYVTCKKCLATMRRGGLLPAPAARPVKLPGSEG